MTKQQAEAEAEQRNANRAPYRRWYATQSAQGEWSVVNLPSLEP